MKMYAFRGATHLMRPEDAGRYLALRAASRMWELPSWVDHYRLSPQDWPELREVVRGVLAGGPVSRDQLAAGVTEHARFGHLGEAFAGVSDTFLKPFAWQGDLCFGPERDGRATCQAPAMSLQWAGIPDLEVAGRAAVLAYVDAYGPATSAPGSRTRGSFRAPQRPLVTRGANLVLVGGVVHGTWKLRGSALTITWFPGVAAPSADLLERPLAVNQDA